MKEVRDQKGYIHRPFDKQDRIVMIWVAIYAVTLLAFHFLGFIE